jgi:hypothetical protein
MKIKYRLLKFIFLLNQFGIDVIKFLNSLRSLPSFFYDLWRFKKNYKGVLKFSPCLHDRYEEAGVTKSEYFWQDLLVARFIRDAEPIKHVDIGSRIDGFVAHIASFREVEVFDIRPMSTAIPNITFRQIDIMNSNSFRDLYENEEYCDSLSCLHAIEHFGLGRYGDQINHQGYNNGIQNMAKLLGSDGLFYLSTPIGKERVEFNANWVFDPRTIIKIAIENNLKLKSLTIFSHDKGVYELDPNEKNLLTLAEQNYNLGIFIFIKI